jgi:hypothetical protein
MTVIRQDSKNRIMSRTDQEHCYSALAYCSQFDATSETDSG